MTVSGHRRSPPSPSSAERSALPGAASILDPTAPTTSGGRVAPDEGGRTIDASATGSPPRSRRPTPTCARSYTSTARVPGGCTTASLLCRRQRSAAVSRAGGGADVPRLSRRRHDLRFADLRVDPSGRFVVAVRELHHPDANPERSRRDRHRWVDGDLRALERQRLYVSPRCRDGTRLVWAAGTIRTCLGCHPPARRTLAGGALGDIEQFGNGAEAWVEPGWVPTARSTPAAIGTSGGISVRCRPTPGSPR